MTLTHNTLTSNTARQSGGDIFKTSDSSVIVQDSIFINTSPADFLINENIVLNDTNYIPDHHRYKYILMMKIKEHTN